jgi:tRNA (cytidine56-2'-O)-methyltransferase
MDAVILRLSHRAERDKRVTTHLGLVARAFGASKLIVTGAKDAHMADSIQRVVTSWGGPFEVEFAEGWPSTVAKYRKLGYRVAHLTMYGLPVQKEMSKIRKNKKLLVIVGGEKVPFEVYQAADYNISVTSQPHSEISALAIFLDRFFGGKELEKTFKNRKIAVIPQACGKKFAQK